MYRIQPLIIQFLKKKYKTKKLTKEILEKEGLDIVIKGGEEKKILLVGKIQKDIIQWAKNNPQKGLLVIAPPGVGKTQAVKFALKILKLPYVWLDLPDIYEKNKIEDFFEELQFAKLVVIDEIRKPFAEKDESIFFLERAISKIYQSGKIPIFIFNPPKEEYEKSDKFPLKKEMQKKPSIPGLTNLSDIAISKLIEITQTINYIGKKTFNFRYIKAKM